MSCARAEDDGPDGDGEGAHGHREHGRGSQAVECRGRGLVAGRFAALAAEGKALKRGQHGLLLALAIDTAADG